MKCFVCRNRANFCACDDPNLNLNAFSLILAKTSTGSYAYLLIKDFDVLCNFMDVTSSEQDQTLDFLKKNAELKISLENLMGDKTSIKSSERKKIFSFFNKLVSKKVVYGFLMAKTVKDNNFEGSIVPQDFK